MVPFVVSPSHTLPIGCAKDPLPSKPEPAGKQPDQDMTGTWNRIDRIRQIEFANAVAVEIERVLARQGKVTNSDAVVAAGRVAGAVAAAVALLAPTDISAIDTMQERLPGMASRFVRILADEAAERRARTHLSTAHEGQGADIQRLAGTGDLDSMRLEDWAGRVAGSTFLQQNLGISRSTLHRWQRSGTVVALRTGGRKHVFPLAQFIDGRPAPGIKEVLSAMPDPRHAWSWLIGPAPGLAGRIPIAQTGSGGGSLSCRTERSDGQVGLISLPTLEVYSKKRTRRRNVCRVPIGLPANGISIFLYNCDSVSFVPMGKREANMK